MKGAYRMPSTFRISTIINELINLSLGKPCDKQITILKHGTPAISGILTNHRCLPSGNPCMIIYVGTVGSHRCLPMASPCKIGDVFSVGGGCRN